MNFTKIALNVIETEASAILNLTQTINQSFADACHLILNSSGKLIVTGIGKSGLIGKKIAATLSSTGTPSIFLHPSEAIHGDFGIVQPQDIILAISHSGQTEEICKLLPAFQQKKIPLIAITSQMHSNLAQAATICLSYGETREACPLGLAPTSSTTISLVLGDALAVALLEARKFNVYDFANNHPGGNLGKKFVLAFDLAHIADEVPLVKEDDTLLNCLIEISAKKLGMACICNDQQQLIGVITDGDIRRGLIGAENIDTLQIVKLMNPQPKTINQSILAQEAISLMEQYQITSLVITDAEQQILGVLHIHDLIKAGFSI